jgi:hypothetical protein
MNNGKMHIIIGLPCRTCGRKSPLPRVRHDNEHTLRRIISFRSKCPKQSMRPFLFRVDAIICLNGAFHVSTTILRFVVVSAAEAKLGALYHNCQMGIIF